MQLAGEYIAIALFCSATGIVAQGDYALPSTYMITDVPWHQQLNALELQDLKALIASNIPVIGYNDTEKAVYFSDPWGRDLKHKTKLHWNNQMDLR